MKIVQPHIALKRCDVIVRRDDPEQTRLVVVNVHPLPEGRAIVHTYPEPEPEKNWHFTMDRHADKRFQRLSMRPHGGPSTADHG